MSGQNLNEHNTAKRDNSIQSLCTSARREGKSTLLPVVQYNATARVVCGGITNLHALQQHVYIMGVSEYSILILFCAQELVSLACSIDI